MKYESRFFKPISHNINAMLMQNPFEELVTALGGSILVLLVLLLVLLIAYLILGVYCMKLGIKAVKGEKTGFGQVFLTMFLNLLIGFGMSIIQMLISFVPYINYIIWILTLILVLYNIKKRHNTSFLGAFGAVLIAGILIGIFMVLLIFIVLLLFGLPFASLFEALVEIFVTQPV